MAKGDGFSIAVPATTRGPHQSPDLKYYRRFETQRVGMTDQEIRDVMSRCENALLAVTAELLGTVGPNAVVVQRDPDNFHSTYIKINFTVSNLTDRPAEYATLAVLVDTNLKVSDYAALQPRSGIIQDGVAFNRYTSSLGLPSQAPIFKEHPVDTFYLAVQIKGYRAGLVRDFGIGCEVRAPRFAVRRRYSLRQLDYSVSLQHIADDELA